MKPTVSEVRREKLRRLREGSFDLLIVGGGINGAGIAREAALRGLRTALVEKGDFASGTSSRSSKLIHGGFRYLEEGDFGLVLEASRERDLLRRTLAPHLVHPLRFFFPVYRGATIGRWKLRAGLLLYDLLAAFRNIDRHRMVSPRAVSEVEPHLRTEGCGGGALYHDCWTDDARLVLENLLGAEHAGATCVNYVSVEEFGKGNGKVEGARVRDRDGDGGGFTIRARIVLNATGPWLDRVRLLDDPAATPVLRLTKGVHLVVDRDRIGNRNAIVLHAVRDGRILFVIPWGDHSLVGTTDTDFTGPPDEVSADSNDVAYLLETVNHYFPAAKLGEHDIVSTFAGLRPLVATVPGEAPSKISREDALIESPSQLLSLGGGKLTTYRRVAIQVVDRVTRELAVRFGARFAKRSGTAVLPLPGAGPTDTGDGIENDEIRRLRSLYGPRAALAIDLMKERPELAERLVQGLPYVRAEAVLAAETEMARRVDDVLRRRLGVALRRPDGGGSIAEAVAALMAPELDWNEGEADRRARDFRNQQALQETGWKRRA